MNQAYLSLGSNQGDRQLWLAKAIEMLAKKAGRVVTISSYYEMKPWGVTDQPDFLNMCLLLEMDLEVMEILWIIQEIEIDLGRDRARSIKWGPRTIDIDILFYNDEIIRARELIVPHPFIQERRFVLEPMVEIAPGFIHPVLGKSMVQLLAECPE